MNLNADFAKLAVVHAATLDWKIFGRAKSRDRGHAVIELVYAALPQRCVNNSLSMAVKSALAYPPLGFGCGGCEPLQAPDLP